ncbi:peptidoglycan-associated lipoprotein Pal [Albidovulum sediminis]|uniref:Peptidoglycan-associated lipoprotein n=1 Tax=Albidovulum sediminis TaxID=3066345 RepID=A0ABT2NM01_9RHOB|nr:peptidoglycan-associated lipoprotein Pal [Defluviimonas sediminis]MCT8329948.1 peptidoglycan-associated lipoprotein Pal [Defluviimonas sediminis]
MNKLSMILLLTGALGVSACNNPDRFGAGGDGGAGAPGGITAASLGDPNDPNSPAYFNQTIGDTVRFAVDQSILTPESQNVLAGQAQWMNQHAQYSAVIEGHADEQGTREYNIALGARRASAVQEFLIAQGVSPARLRTVSYGKERPLAICSDETCYAQNRRAVTVITVGGGV